MTTIICVYKTGGSYFWSYVKALKASLDVYETRYNRFVCLTNADLSNEMTGSIELWSLRHNLPGWWSKIELFELGKFGQGETVIYFDLDTLILRNINHIIKVCEVATNPLMLLGRAPDTQYYRFPASGMMSWKGDAMNDVYKNFFRVGPLNTIKKQERSSYKSGQKGDQGFIRKYISPTLFQDILSDGELKFKFDYKEEGSTALNASILLWSGKPRMPQAPPKIYKIWEMYVRRFEEVSVRNSNGTS